MIKNLELSYDDQMELLTRKNILTISTKMCRKIGVIPAVVFAVLFEKYSEQAVDGILVDGSYFKANIPSIQEQTGLSTRAITFAISKLKKEKMISSRLIGIPACGYFCINASNVLKTV